MFKKTVDSDICSDVERPTRDLHEGAPNVLCGYEVLNWANSPVVCRRNLKDTAMGWT